MPRRCFVIDPAWKRVERESYAAAWQQLAEEATGCKFVGLDLEWTSRPEPIIGEESSKNGDAEGVLEGTAAVRKRPNSVGPVAVVQLSTFSVTFVIKLCDVVRLTGGGDCGSRREDIVEPSTLGLVKTNLRSLLADECVSKVGVGILGDQAKLQRDYADFKLIPCVDLAVLARRLLPACEDVAGLRSLKALAARFAGTVLEKDILVTRSDWGGVLGPLSPLQVQYAAADAEASFDTCVGILRESHVVEGDEALRAACGSEEALRSVGAVLQAVSGVKPVTRKAHRKKYGEDGNALWRCKGRAKPYYHNIFVYDAEMNLVFTVDKSKAEWYVYKKGLAKVTEWRDAGSGGESSEPRKEIAAIQLSFTPDFAKYNDAYIRRNLDYFRQPKENQCVVCGNASDLVRFAVVPLVYRKYFPSVYMSHNSYDLLLLCTACFAVARSFYDNERRCIAEDFGVPLAHLTPREVEAYRAQQQQTNMTAIAAAAEEAKGCPSLAQKAHLMQAYLDIEGHREILLNIFKYAKALRAAYDVPAPDTERDVETTEATPTATGNDREECARRTLAKPAVIPPKRVAQLAEYIRQHAPPYPFARCAEEQTVLFAADAACPASVTCILEEGVSARAVLTRFWLHKHPEVRDLFGCTTRKSERRGDDSLPGWREGGDKSEENFFVDSHGFLVVQALLQKYDGHASRGRDHAVGEFIHRWRTAFLRGLQPRHLPEGWCAEDGILL